MLSGHAALPEAGGPLPLLGWTGAANSADGHGARGAPGEAHLLAGCGRQPPETIPTLDRV